MDDDFWNDFENFINGKVPVFIKEILPHLQNTNLLFVYEGIGITNLQAEAVMAQFDLEQKAVAKTQFKTNYINKLKL